MILKQIAKGFPAIQIKREQGKKKWDYWGYTMSVHSRGER